MNKILTFMKSTFSFEGLLILFLFSYQYKHIGRIFEEVDWGLLLSLPIILLGGSLYFQKKHLRPHMTPPQWFFIAWALWMILSAFWSIAGVNGAAKAIFLLLFTMPAFFTGSLLVGSDDLRLARFLTLTLLFSLLTLIGGLTIYALTPGQIQMAFGTTYLVTGQTLGIGFLLLLDLNKKSSTRLVSILTSFAAGAIIFLMLHLGGRGPLLSLGFTLIFYIFLNKMHLKRILSFLALMSVSLLMMYGAFKFLTSFETPMASLERLQSLLHPKGDGAILERLEYFKSAWHAFISAPIFGLGIGGWPTYQALSDPQLHPHNIFLEIMAEAGIVGLLLFLLFLVTSFYKFWLSGLRFVPLYVLVFCFINALKSGDIIDNILFFAFLGLSLGITQKKTHPYKKV